MNGVLSKNSAAARHSILGIAKIALSKNRAGPGA
jgi:hypothetical protein